jgi:serine/threonine-protein kinase
MAPEQVLCKPVDRRTDLFIIGVALWEIVAGKKMWKGLADMEIFNLILSGYVPRLADEHPDTPPMLIQICERALAIEPDDRYQTAAELRGDLLAYLERAGRRFTNEDIGQLVGELFADERLALKAVIDRQLNLLGDREAPTLVDARNHVGPATSTSPDGGISQPLSTLSIIAGDKSAIGRRTTAKAELRRMLLTAGLSAIVASIFALVFVKGSSTTTETVPQAPVTAAPPATAQEPTQEPTLMPRVIELRIVARPSSAQLFLDDIRLEKNPFVGKFPADGARHLVRVMAPGYTQQKTFAEFSGDVVLEFDLEKKTIVQRRPKGKATVGAQP